MKQTLEEVSQKGAEGYNIVGQIIYKSGFRAGAEWHAKQSPWISVEMAIPKDDSPGVVQVITVDGKEGEMAARRVMYNIYPYIKTGYVTHWRPIPALPKGGEG